MPRWTLPGGSIKKLVVYHGTDDSVLTAGGGVNSQTSFSVNLTRCAPNTEFGQGFYVTTSEHQAIQWANARYVTNPANVNALLLRFELDRDWLASLETLTFVRPTSDFWDLVDDCHLGFRPHQRPPPHNPPFDVVYGPVKLLAKSPCDSGLRSDKLPYPTGGSWPGEPVDTHDREPYALIRAR